MFWNGLFSGLCQRLIKIRWKNVSQVGCEMVKLTLKLWDSISNVEARVWATHLFGGRLIPCFLLKFGSPNSKIVKTLYMITDPFKIFRICISWISSNQIWVADESHADNDFMEFVLHLVAWQSQHLMQKHRKWTAHLPLSTGCFLIVFFLLMKLHF